MSNKNKAEDNEDNKNNEDNDEDNEDDEQRKINYSTPASESEEDQMRSMKSTSSTIEPQDIPMKLLDLPLELQEQILMEAIVSEIRDRKLLRYAWNKSADRVAERLRTVCPLWDYVLTTDVFQNRLHAMLDRFPEIEFSFTVRARHRYTNCMAVTALNNDVFVLLCQRLLQQHACINVYDGDDLQTTKRVIQLPDVTMPWNLVACSLANCLYLLHQISGGIEIWRVLLDEHSESSQVSPWIKCSNQNVSRMSVSADGSLILFQGPVPSTIKVYNVDGSLQHEMELKSVSILREVVSKSNGNFVLVTRKGLTEVDRDGKTVNEYSERTGEYIYCAVDLFDRLVTIDDGGRVRLLDCEFNSMNANFGLESYGINNKHCYRVHYNRKRNEFVAFESAAFCDAHADQCLTIFRFTESWRVPVF